MLQKTMKAAILKEFHSDLIIETVPIPSPGHGEVLVRVKASGLCASDLHIQDGMLPTVTLPFTPGHEMAGIVEELGEGVTGLSVGEHVVCAIDITCGVCRFCRRGKQNLCKSLVGIKGHRTAYRRQAGQGGHRSHTLISYSAAADHRKIGVHMDKLPCKRIIHLLSPFSF